MHYPMGIIMNNAILALNQAVQDAGVEFFANYPGFHSNEMFDNQNGMVTSVDEKTAFAYAWGCSLAGKRSVVSFKNVGLNDAADAFLGAHFIGCRAGLVLVLFDDCDIQHSQNRIDVRPYFDIYGGLWFEPKNISDIYTMTLEAFGLSEKFELPVVIRITNILYDMGMDPLTQGSWKRAKCETVFFPPISRLPDSSPYVAHPSQAKQQEFSLVEKNRRIAEFIDIRYKAWKSITEPPPQLICGAKRNVMESNALHIDTLPGPWDEIRRIFSGEAPGDVTVYEHGASPFMKNKLSAVLSHSSLKSVNMAPMQGIKFKYHNYNTVENLFLPLCEIDNSIVIGDLGSYTMDPHRTIMAALCYGTCIATAMGFAHALTDRNIFAITGDAAYLHSGQSCLWELKERGVKLSIFVFNNGGARGTGGQRIPGDLRSHPDNIRLCEYDYHSMSSDDFRKVISDNLQQKGSTLNIIHIQEENDAKSNNPS